MAKLTGSKLTVESFKDQSSWIGKLLVTLNQFIGETVGAFNNNITIEDNLFQELKDVKFVNSSGNYPLKFTSKIAKVPKAVTLVYCLNETQSTTEAITTLPVWYYSNGQIVIESISGLTADHKYFIRVHVIYG